MHIDPPKPLDEKKIQDMAQLLQQFQDRYLNLLGERLSGEENKRFLHCKRKVEVYEGSQEDIEESEQFLLQTAHKFGFLILHGDLLSVSVAEAALRLRKSAHTVIERLRFIRFVRLGDFHLNMANS